MSALDLIVETGAGPHSGTQLVEPIKQRLMAARDARKAYEPTWHSNLAFAAGKHWLQWDRFQRMLVMPQELKDKELYTADVITEYRTTALGELGSDDDRPELPLPRDERDPLPVRPLAGSDAPRRRAAPRRQASR